MEVESKPGHVQDRLKFLSIRLRRMVRRVWIGVTEPYFGVARELAHSLAETAHQKTCFCQIEDQHSRIFNSILFALDIEVRETVTPQTQHRPKELIPPEGSLTIVLNLTKRQMADVQGCFQEQTGGVEVKFTPFS